MSKDYSAILIRIDQLLDRYSKAARHQRWAEAHEVALQMFSLSHEAVLAAERENK
jgi:hypothetical protein